MGCSTLAGQPTAFGFAAVGWCPLAPGLLGPAAGARGPSCAARGSRAALWLSAAPVYLPAYLRGSLVCARRRGSRVSGGFGTS